MYTQLIRHLERRPEQYSPEGVNNMQTLLLMDEFARFGKLEMITHAAETLRSKNVNICLVVQSLAQLDKIYGEYDRRIILDTCKFQAVLRANDADTQEFISRLIGTHPVIHRGRNESFDDFMEPTGYSNQFTETREYIVFPHELSTLTDILLITPYGFCRVDKLLLDNDLTDNPLLPERIVLPATAKTATSAPSIPIQIGTWYQLSDNGTLIRDNMADSQNNKTLRFQIISVKPSASTDTNEIP